MNAKIESVHGPINELAAIDPQILLAIIQKLGLDFSRGSALPSRPPQIEDIKSEEDFNSMGGKYGFGSVYENKERGCFQAAFYMVEGGVKKRKILSAPSYDEAVLMMAQLRSGKMAYVSEKEIPAPQQYHTVGEIWNYILKYQKAGIKESSRRWYMDIAKPMIDQLGDKNIEELTSKDVQAFTLSLKYREDGGLSSESKVKKTTEQLKAVIRYAINEGYITRNPYNGNVKRPKGIQRDPRETAYTKKEVIKLLNAVAHENSIVLSTLVKCLLLSGMRIGEFVTLRYSDLNRKQGTIHVCHSVDKHDDGTRSLGTTKTEAGDRVIPVPKQFFEAIDAWSVYVRSDKKRVARIKAQGTEDIIFTASNGTIRNADTARNHLNEITKKAGLKKPNSSFHGLRRTYASLMHDSGVDVETISVLLGHKPDLDDGCQVARKHYIRPNQEINLFKKCAAVKKYMEFMSGVFD